MERLYEQAKKNKSLIKILDYLKEFASNDEVFKSKLENENKNVKDMYSYIYNQASKEKQGNTAMIDDNTVFGWAVHYFDEDNIEIKEKTNFSSGIESKPKEKTKPKKLKVAPKEDNQLSLFDL